MSFPPRSSSSSSDALLCTNCPCQDIHQQLHLSLHRSPLPPSPNLIHITMANSKEQQHETELSREQAERAKIVLEKASYEALIMAVEKDDTKEAKIYLRHDHIRNLLGRKDGHSYAIDILKKVVSKGRVGLGKYLLGVEDDNSKPDTTKASTYNQASYFRNLLYDKRIEGPNMYEGSL